jgi:uncharacterized protein YigE (DUF2233 family)
LSVNSTAIVLAALGLAVSGPVQIAAQPGPGCVSKGKWYPEGARIAPDPRSRIAAAGVFVCRNGKWVFEKG